MDHLITTAALAARIGGGDRHLVVLDASFYLPTEQIDPRAVFAQGHIPGAQFFDIDQVADQDSDLPHMLPGSAQFAEAMAALGIGDATDVVVYDQRGLFSAARVWWMLLVFGHERVAVLDGGLPKWRAEGRALAVGAARPAERGQFTARFDASRVRDRAQVAEAVLSGDAVILDARAPARFAGSAPEPRPGLRAGHVPGAVSMPFQTMLHEDQTLKSPEALRAWFAAHGIDGQRAVMTMCGSGVTAAVVSLGLHHAGLPMGGLYDGSWAEWGGRADCAVATGLDGTS